MCPQNRTSPIPSSNCRVEPPLERISRKACEAGTPGAKLTTHWPGSWETEDITSRLRIIRIGHAIIASFEPGEDWFYDYGKRAMIEGVRLLPPHSHPKNQSVPGPVGRVPANWESLLN